MYNKRGDSMYELKYKIWLEQNGKCFGEGPYQLLKGIEETGSLNTAARAIKMSYSQAYTLIKAMEKRLGFTLIVSQAGGSGGGGSELTPEARDLMQLYHDFYDECTQALHTIFNKYFK